MNQKTPMNPLITDLKRAVLMGHSGNLEESPEKCGQISANQDKKPGFSESTRKNKLKSACLPKERGQSFPKALGRFRKHPESTAKQCINPNFARKQQVYHDLNHTHSENQHISLDILPMNQSKRADSPSKRMLKRAKARLLTTLHGQSIHDIYKDRKEKRNSALTIIKRHTIHIPFDIKSAHKWVIAAVHNLPRYENTEFGKYRNLYTRGRILDISPLQVLKVLYHQHSIHRVDYRASCKIFNHNALTGRLQTMIRIISEARKQPFFPRSPFCLSLSFRELKNKVKTMINSYLSSKIKNRSGQNSMASIHSRATARQYHKFEHQGILYSLPVKRNIFIHPLKIQEQFIKKFELSNSLMPELSSHSL